MWCHLVNMSHTKENEKKKEKRKKMKKRKRWIMWLQDGVGCILFFKYKRVECKDCQNDLIALFVHSCYLEKPISFIA